MDISHVTNKFPHYHSREAMVAEHHRTAHMMEQFVVAMASDIEIIRAAGYTFSVFWIRDDQRTLHCGLYHCCKEPVQSAPHEVKEDLALKIYRKLPYDKIVWEI